MYGSSKEFREAIGNRLRGLRHKHGLSMRDVCKETNLSLGFFCDMEKGKRQPSARTLLALSEFYGVSIDWIVTGKTG